MTASSKNQRRFPRVPAEYAVLVKHLGLEAEEAFAKTRVLGLGGCMFVRDEALGEGAAIELLISIRGQVIKTTARVVYESAHPSGGVEIGCEFLFVSDKDRQILEGVFQGRQPFIES